jgi:GTP-binding protein YchF
VVRIFEDEKVMHVNDRVDPLFDIEVINYELVAADIETCRNRKNAIQKDVKKGDKKFIMLDALIDKLLANLEADKLVSQMYEYKTNGDIENFTEEEVKEIKMLNLITAKKFLYVLNKKAGGKNLDEINDPRYVALIEFLNKNNFEYVIIDAKIEDELKDFEGEEKEMMRGELGGTSDGIKDLIVGGYKMLGLETYFTTGVEETRGWTIKKGSTAPVAGQAIHTDFKEKFIRAQVVDFKTLLELGSFAKCKETGKLRMEGKEYIVKDGDVIEFFV